MTTAETTPQTTPKDASTMPSWTLAQPGSGYLGSSEVMAVALGIPGFSLLDLGTLAGGGDTHRVLALRYLLANGAVWRKHFDWQKALEKALLIQGLDGSEKHIAAAKFLMDRLEGAPVQDAAWMEKQLGGPLVESLENRQFDGNFHTVLKTLHVHPELHEMGAAFLAEHAALFVRSRPGVLDLLYATFHKLTSYPATTVGAGSLKYVIIADKGEMGTRATREAIALGKIPVVCHSLQDDLKALQVRVALEGGGFCVGLTGNFRESYANYQQISEKVKATFKERFGSNWEAELAQAAIYPGYGPLAENAAAIRHFRREGLVFVGPMQDVVENAGDKRKFRLMAQGLEPKAVTPGIIIDSDDPAQIEADILAAHKAGAFTFPGRLKAANGGGGRGQAVIPAVENVAAAIKKVQGEIETYNWDAGVMFEQNIPETIHLEVQVLRDRYGNTRHFGMRDCSEQRASQKVQEEAPPSLLKLHPGMEQRIETLACGIAAKVGYVGAGTVELMFKDSKYYFLEMNTRIQVEHPVSEEAYAIERAPGELEPVNLVQWQMRIANGQPINFSQAQIVNTHVAREFRINAESWNGDLRDSRDSKKGIFIPNAGIFDNIQLPDAAKIKKAVARKGLLDVKIRFDTGFEVGDTLVNKDPTFGKLIVAVKAEDPSQAYELLRLVSLEVLRTLKMEGRQVRPDGTVVDGSVFKTNIQDHMRILEMPLFVRHSSGDDTGRHVNWVVNAFRAV